MIIPWIYEGCVSVCTLASYLLMVSETSSLLTLPTQQQLYLVNYLQKAVCYNQFESFQICAWKPWSQHFHFRDQIIDAERSRSHKVIAAHRGLFLWQIVQLASALRPKTLCHRGPVQTQPLSGSAPSHWLDPLRGRCPAAARLTHGSFIKAPEPLIRPQAAETVSPLRFHLCQELSRWDISSQDPTATRRDER